MTEAEQNSTKTRRRLIDKRMMLRNARESIAVIQKNLPIVLREALEAEVSVEKQKEATTQLLR